MQLTALTIDDLKPTFAPEFHNYLDMVPICQHKLHHGLLDHYVECLHHRRGASLSFKGR